MTPVVVRRAQPDDWAALREVRLAALLDAPSAFLTTHAEAARLSETDWRDRAAAGGTVLAWRDRRPIGMAAGYLLDGIPQLVAMWVEPRSRGQGVVEALIDAIVEWAEEQGATELRLGVVTGNVRAEKAYERYGFTRTGISRPVPGRPDEMEVEMAYLLHQAGPAKRSEGHVDEG